METVDFERIVIERKPGQIRATMDDKIVPIMDFEQKDGQIVIVLRVPQS